ncbi:MAG: hypothetical protein QOG25_267 [Acetobacteraceae bacterium]|nr:hypothetical protein [Acetobacteraceae bacterium]
MKTLTKKRLYLVAALGLAMGLGPASAWAFDMAGFKVRLEATKAEAATKTLVDSKATLARLDEMIKLGETGAKEYGDRQPKFAKLMAAVVADAEAMKGFTDSEIEAKWGEQGSGGDALGIPLKSLGQFDETRAAMELIVSPAHAYIFVKKWETAQKARWLDQARDELNELGEHLKQAH